MHSAPLENLTLTADLDLEMLHDLEKKNYYEILGVTPDASREEIARVYRDLSRIFHPDSNFYADIVDDRPSEQHVKAFQIISQAYNTLIDDYKRAQYNDWLFLEQHPTLQGSITPTLHPTSAISQGIRAPGTHQESDYDEARFAKAYREKPRYLKRAGGGYKSSTEWAEALPSVSQVLRRTRGSNPYYAIAYAFLGAIFGGCIGGVIYLLIAR